MVYRGNLSIIFALVCIKQLPTFLSIVEVMFSYIDGKDKTSSAVVESAGRTFRFKPSGFR